MTNGEILVACGLVLNLVIALRAGQWGLPDRLAKMEAKIMAAVAGNKSALDEEIDKIVSKLDDRDGSIRREFGETVRAMQQKISDVEKYVRDTYLPKNDFTLAISDLKEALREKGRADDQRVHGIEKKIDGLTSHLLGGKPPA
jgi:hypothetical protein